MMMPKKQGLSERTQLKLIADESCTLYLLRATPTSSTCMSVVRKPMTIRIRNCRSSCVLCLVQRQATRWSVSASSLPPALYYVCIYSIYCLGGGGYYLLVSLSFLSLSLSHHHLFPLLSLSLSLIIVRCRFLKWNKKCNK